MILYLARLGDYSKELNFWRDTIRKITYNSTNKNNGTESIIDIVTKSLKTYRTRGTDDEKTLRQLKH